MEETKRKRYSNNMGKKKVKERFHGIFKSKEHELVLFICIYTSMTLVGAYYLPEELKEQIHYYFCHLSQV